MQDGGGAEPGKWRKRAEFNAAFIVPRLHQACQKWEGEIVMLSRLLAGAVTVDKSLGVC